MTIYCRFCGAVKTHCNCATRLGGIVGAVWPTTTTTLAAPPGQRPAPCPPPPQTCGLSTTGGHGTACVDVAVICAKHHEKVARKLWPDAGIIPPMSPMLGWRFRRIIVLWAPERERDPTHGRLWLDEFCSLKLRPDGDVVTLT